MQSFSRIDTHVIKSHVGKEVELLFLEADNKAISKTQIAFGYDFQNHIRSREGKIELQKNRYKIF